jgi:uncharacterized membrane protein
MQTTGLAIAGAFAAALVATGAQAASLDLSKQINASGVQPRWNLTVTNGIEFQLSRAGKPALAAKAPGAQISAGGVSWTATTADGQPLIVHLQNATCAVGSSKYPMTAQVEVGGQKLTGCAGY